MKYKTIRDDELSGISQILGSLLLAISHLKAMETELHDAYSDYAQATEDLMANTPVWHGFYDLGITAIFDQLVGRLGGGSIQSLMNRIGFIPVSNDAVEPFMNALESHLDPPEGEDFLELMSCFSAVHNSIESVDKFSLTVGELIRLAKEGDNIALFKAIYIDPSLQFHPAFKGRIQAAQAVKDSRFLAKLSAAIRQTSPRPNESGYSTLRLMLVFLIEMQLFERLSYRQKAIIVIDHLGVYSNEGDDPEGSLKEYIKKFRKIRGKAKI